MNTQDLNIIQILSIHLSELTKNNLFLSLICFRKLYWTDQGTESGIPAKVASADMDGSNPATLFTGNMLHIEFITLDIRENKLYWAVTSTGVVSTYGYFILLPFSGFGKSL